MKKICSVILAIVMSTTLVACGTSDRDIYSDAGEVITDTAFNELSKQLPDRETDDKEDKNESSETDTVTVEDSEVTEEPEESDVETDTETDETKEYALNPDPLDDPDYSNENPLVYGKLSKILDLDPAQFWLDENTFDLNSYIFACGATFYPLKSDFAINDSYIDPQNDNKEIATSFNIWIRGITIELYTDAVLPIDDNGGWNRILIHDGDKGNNIIGGVRSTNIIHIYGYDQVVTREGLETIITVFRRILNDDNKCPLRGLNIDHTSENGNHLPVQHDD